MKKEFILKYGIPLITILFLLDIIGLFFFKPYIDLSIFADIMNLLISGIVAGFAFLCYSHSSIKHEKKFLFYLSLAFAFRFIGEALWAYYDLSTGVMPAFSFADLAWILSNFAILFAFEFKIDKPFMDKKNIIMIFFAVSLIILSIAFLFGIYLKLLFISQNLWLAYLVNEFYVLFDFFILILIIGPLYFSAHGLRKSFPFYFFIAFGFIATIIYDFLFAEMNLAGIYDSGGKMEMLYFFSYFLIYIAFHFKYKFLGKND
jgi:hypothetical protein